MATHGFLTAHNLPKFENYLPHDDICLLYDERDEFMLYASPWIEAIDRMTTDKKKRKKGKVKRIIQENVEGRKVPKRNEKVIFPEASQIKCAEKNSSTKVINHKLEYLSQNFGPMTLYTV